ncbi:UNVERIFIED_CONTAM: hypothetical protein Sradi_4373300 [Sesamum radiatum]|uniref:Uncharacterized protein n=1 Tax=Sesamum radiatum TaxID=300843 RepID=A0AAW2NNF9_SESRA
MRATWKYVSISHKKFSSSLVLRVPPKGFGSGTFTLDMGARSFFLPTAHFNTFTPAYRLSSFTSTASVRMLISSIAAVTRSPITFGHSLTVFCNVSTLECKVSTRENSAAVETLGAAQVVPTLVESGTLIQPHD